MAVVAIDAHCHADMLMQNESFFPVSYKELGLAGITWAYTETIDSWQAYPHYWESLRQLSRTLIQEGVPFYYLVGIHPRSITADLKEQSDFPPELTEALSLHMESPQCLGLGELGLDSGDAMEEKVLRWQMDWAVKALPAERRIGVHTPRNNKEAVTRQTLNLLQDYASLGDRILLDHVSREILPLVLTTGYMMGVTLQDGKTSVPQLMDLLREHPELSSRILLNSDGAKGLSAPYLEFLKKPDLLDQEVRQALLLDNAARFFLL